jgi:hypothetical protein
MPAVDSNWFYRAIVFAIEAAYREIKKLVYDSTLCISKILSNVADIWHREFFSMRTAQDKDLYLNT